MSNFFSLILLLLVSSKNEEQAMGIRDQISENIFNQRIKEENFICSDNITEENLPNNFKGDNICAYDSTFNDSIVLLDKFLYISKCTFQSIFSNYFGGAICFVYSNAYSKSNFIDNCTFIECISASDSTALSQGGAISFSSKVNTDLEIESIDIINCIFINNSANSQEKDETKKSAEARGGAISCSGNKKSLLMNIIDCVFINNTAISSQAAGGALYLCLVYGNIDNCIFIDNYAGYENSPASQQCYSSIYFEDSDSDTNQTKYFQNNIIEIKITQYDRGTFALVQFNGKNNLTCEFRNNTIHAQKLKVSLYLFYAGGTGEITCCKFIGNCIKGDAVNYIGIKNVEDFKLNNQCPPTCMFSESQLFSESSFFSNSNKFSDSMQFSNSGKFSNSQEFSNSGKFSDSIMFSNSDKFSNSLLFSNSDKFSSSLFFSNSDKFSNSLLFSNSDKFSSSFFFSNSDKFSNSLLFSNSGKFSSSFFFSNSDKFSSSLFFSNSDKFSNSLLFSNSEKFSNSQEFSNSNKFSDSFSFSGSTKFSYSSMFTLTQHFSLTSKFSESTVFSFSGKFTHSYLFSGSAHFTETTKFSYSDKFSKSKQFSNSICFTPSGDFSKTFQFSKSSEFSPSAELIPENPECRIWEDDDSFVLDRCIYNVNDKKLVFALVLLSNFSGYKSDSDGSAVHLTNCGVQCNDTMFVDCVSTKGGGGAVYIDNSFDIVDNVSFTDVTFIHCSALYGGAVFVTLRSSSVSLNFTRCRFELNEASLSRAPSEGNKNLFGGSALFVISEGISVYNSSFIKNKGGKGAVKFIRSSKAYSKASKLESDENEKSVLFFGCEFEQDRNSKSSISIVDQSNQKWSNIEVNNCIFRGEISKGSHYIDGKLKSKEILELISCSFESKNNESVKIDVLNNDSQIGIEINNSIKSLLSNAYIFAIVFAILIAIFIVGFIMKFNNCLFNQKRKQYPFINEFTDALFDNEMKTL